MEILPKRIKALIKAVRILFGFDEHSEHWFDVQVFTNLWPYGVFHGSLPEIISSN